MLRKILLITMAILASHSLALVSGYGMYSLSSRMSEAHLSLVVRFVSTPLIVVITGGLVGFLSENRPIPTSLVGLAPFLFNLLGPSKPNWAPAFGYLTLGAIAALVGYRTRQARKSDNGSLVILNASTSETLSQ
jgi:hypothetical protein